MSKQAVSAKIISKFSCWNIFPKQKEQTHKQLGYIDIEINIFTPKGQKDLKDVSE
jgi:hypothetical protein